MWRAPALLCLLGLSLGLWCATSVAAAAQDVSVDMSKLDDATYARVDGLSLHERLVLRLVQEGFAVVESGGRLVVTLSGTPEALRVQVARDDGAVLKREIPLGGAPSDELQLEVIQKVVTLARRLADEVPPEPPSPEPPVPTISGDPPGAPAPAGEGPRVELAAGVGAMLREGGADVQPRIGARFPVTHDLGVTVDASIAPTGAGTLDIIEWQLLGGVSYRVLLVEPLHFDAGAAIGVRLHHYRLPEADSRGTAVDFSAALPVGLTWMLVDPLALQVRAELGVASSDREHTAAGVSLWRRGLVRGVFGGGIAVRF